MQEAKITDLIKDFSKLISDAKQETKPSRCFLCGKAHDKICYSHSFPKFLMKNLEVDGKICQSVTPDKPGLQYFVKGIKGINNTGIFRMICCDCDNNFFKEYEDEEVLVNFKKLDSRKQNQIMAKIAIKEMLNDLYIKRWEKHYYKKVETYAALRNKNFSAYGFDMVNDLDLNDDERLLNYFLNIVKNKSKNGIKVLYSQRIRKCIPVGCQIHIALNKDLEGNFVNDTHDYDSNVLMSILFICVYPCKNDTLLLAFCADEHYKNYKNFHEQFNKLNEKDKLKVLLTICFSHNENIYFSPRIKNIIYKDDFIRGLLNQTLDNNFSLYDKETSKIYNFSDYADITNYNKMIDFLSL